MKPLLSVFLLLSLALFSQDKPKPAWRTSPLGYSDTPQIPGQKWKIHDISRPHPREIMPGAKAGDPPSDAVVLFDGKNLSKWEPTKKGSWKVENGYMEIVPGAGTLTSKEKFGDAQYHIEWMELDPTGESQWRGNSGILLMSRYEVQVLDSYHAPTYADGQAGAIYGQWPPLVNASRKPHEWQTYDIIWEAPKFEGEKIVKNPYVTVLYNGVLIQNHQKLTGPMSHRVIAPFQAHGAEEPLALQDHDVAVRYRNIWARRIRPYDEP